MKRGSTFVAICATACAIGVPAAQAAPPEPTPYQANDGKGFRDVLPPGTNGLANGPQLAAFLATGQRPAHNDDQRDMYGNLVYAAPGLKDSDLDTYFKDSSFGVKPEDVARRYSPRDDVTIVRDRQFGVPHVTASTRAGAMFGLGYATAEDRLFFIDVLRHLGRAQLTSFVGGAESNRKLDHDQWANAPYTEADLQKQADSYSIYGDEGLLLRRDSEQYVAGINAYIAEAKIDPTKMPGEYAAVVRPQGPELFKLTDLISIASLVGGIFGKGGGGELGSTEIFQAFEQRFGPKKGPRLWADFRSAEDPEAPTTVMGKRFDFNAPIAKPRGKALPDRGTLKREPVVIKTSGSAARASSATSTRASTAPFLRFPKSSSNALLVSASESASGKPIAVFGPQVSYFAPEILMEQDVHAPGIDARGAAFPGTNLYVQLGRGRDYSWSATSAGNDIIDTFALPVCDGGKGYVYRGACLPFEVLEQTNSWSPNAADSTPAGGETLRAYRTKLGIVTGRATIKGKPVVYTSLRSTYFHEVDSGIGFAKLNDPNQIKGPRDFQKAAARIGYTFNWFYIDSKSIAYFNSGNTPRRANRTDPSFPIDGKYPWRGWYPDLWTASYAAGATHPQTIDQPFLFSWNNKQAPGYRADDGRYNYGPVDRGALLRDRIAKGLKGPRKLSLVQLVDMMEDAGTADLRGEYVLPVALKVLGKPADPKLQAAIGTLKAWVAKGAHRVDRNRDKAYDDAGAVALMDAWWPKLVAAVFDRPLGKPLADKLTAYIGLGDMPALHQGSAFDDGVWGQVQKDLRTILGEKVSGRYSRVYCGDGKLKTCRADLTKSLAAALTVPRTELYKQEGCAPGDQLCNDEVRFLPLGGVTQPPIHWINRPTYQQIVEIGGPAPR
jgi:acyl-homoserine lactone acylase PvdQ